MSENKVGKIKNIKYNIESDELELTIIVVDSYFKKKILRDFNLSGKLKIVEDEIIFDGDQNA